jgi:hypothetical protein
MVTPYIQLLKCKDKAIHGLYTKASPNTLFAAKTFLRFSKSGNLCQKQPVSSKFFEVYIIMRGFSGLFWVGKVAKQLNTIVGHNKVNWWCNYLFDVSEVSRLVEKPLGIDRCHTIIRGQKAETRA